MECTDGFVAVGYSKGTHDKFAHFHASEKVCRDALIFFNLPVQTWMNIGSEEDGEEIGKDEIY